MMEIVINPLSPGNVTNLRLITWGKFGAAAGADIAEHVHLDVGTRGR